MSTAPKTIRDPQGLLKKKVEQERLEREEREHHNAEEKKKNRRELEETKVDIMETMMHKSKAAAEEKKKAELRRQQEEMEDLEWHGRFYGCIPDATPPPPQQYHQGGIDPRFWQSGPLPWGMPPARMFPMLAPPAPVLPPAVLHEAFAAGFMAAQRRHKHKHKKKHKKHRREARSRSPLPRKKAHTA